MMERAFPKARVLAFDVDCEWLATLSSTPSDGPAPVILHLATRTPDGGVATFPGSRETFLGLVAPQHSAAGGRRLTEAETRAEQGIDQAFGELNAQAGTTLNIQSVRAVDLGWDEAASYSGAVAKVGSDGQLVVVASVVAVTVIKNIVITVDVTRVYAGSDTFKEMLEETRAIVAALVVANDPKL